MTKAELLAWLRKQPDDIEILVTCGEKDLGGDYDLSPFVVELNEGDPAFIVLRPTATYE